MQKLDNLLKFVEFTHKFQQVKRHILVNHEDRFENDSEHSFQTAMICWYYADANNLQLNMDKIIKYSLVHDLVEVYAGDTFIYEKDQNIIDSKHSRESLALDKIKLEFAEFKDMYEYIVDYEKRTDNESKFVYAFDKIIPILNIYIDKGRTWQEEGIDLDSLVEIKDPKVKVSYELLDLWEELKSTLKVNEIYFHQKLPE